MQAEIIKQELLDGSEVFDVRLSDENDSILIACITELAAMRFISNLKLLCEKFTTEYLKELR